MATFTYKAKTTGGQTVTGVLTAETAQAAMRMLDERSLFPINVAEGGTAARGAITGRKRKLRLRVLTTFYSQLSDLLRAGVPVLRAIDVLSRGPPRCWPRSSKKFTATCRAANRWPRR